MRPRPKRRSDYPVGVTAASDRANGTDLLEALSQRVFVGDGAMGTQLQAADLTLDDFRGIEGCNEIRNDSRPDVIEQIQLNYFEAGVDAVETKYVRLQSVQPW